GGGDPVELCHDLAVHVHFAGAVEHEGVHSGRGGEHVCIGASPLEPVGQEARASLGGGGDAGLPLGEGGLPLALDLETDEGRDEGDAEEEGSEIAPREALARPCGGARWTGEIVATSHA